jgi:crossover junction endodeoxyribonuclease RuvC
VRVLGIDPGLVVTGYGILESEGGSIRLVEAGTIHSGAVHDPLQYRLRRLYEEMDALLEEHEPNAAALEQLYSHYEHPRTAILMGHARGVLCLAAGVHDVALHHYTAPQVKSALTGNGRASKGQIQNLVRRTFGLVESPNPPDVADAVAIALCHIYQQAETSSAQYLRLLKGR